MERMGWWPARQKTIDRDRKGSPVVRTPADSPLITNSLVSMRLIVDFDAPVGDSFDE
jgi:hypothetical protein